MAAPEERAVAAEWFNPEMVVLARTYRELTQGALAKILDVTQSRVSKVEHGLIEPDTLFVASLAKALRMPTAFFYQQGHIYALPARHHRRRKQIPKGVLDRIHAEITIRVMHVAKLLRSVDLESAHEVPEIDLDEVGGTPEDAARTIRERWGIPRGPIPNLMTVFENAGIVVVPCAFGTSEMDAIGMRVPGLPPLMFVNQFMSADRMRYTLAHELGHLVLHSFPREEMEAEADRFAAELLMPELDIRSQLRRLTIQALPILKRIWRVSMAALLKRAEQLKVIPVRVSRGLWVYFASNGWRRREPLEYDLPPEEPTLLQGLITFHLDHLQYSVDGISKVLSVFADEFQALYPGRGLRLVG